MDIALWIITIVATLYLIVRLGLAWMVPDHYRASDVARKKRPLSWWPLYSILGTTIGRLVSRPLLIRPMGTAPTYSALMPANLITLAHFSVASEMSARIPRASRQARCRQLDDPGFDFAVGEAGVELLVQQFDDVGRVFLGAPMPAKPLAS